MTTKEIHEAVKEIVEMDPIQLTINYCKFMITEAEKEIKKIDKDIDRINDEINELVAIKEKHED